MFTQAPYAQSFVAEAAKSSDGSSAEKEGAAAVRPCSCDGEQVVVLRLETFRP